MAPGLSSLFSNFVAQRPFVVLSKVENTYPKLPDPILVTNLNLLPITSPGLTFSVEYGALLLIEN
jgi:hypothetical protein